jgi:uncharacterized membrane protein YoaT (DUF817 family)
MSGKKKMGLGFLFLVVVLGMLATNNLFTFIDFYSRYDQLVVFTLLIMIVLAIIDLKITGIIGGNF